MLEALAAKYGLRILGALLLLAAFFGAIAWIKHSGAVEQHEKDMRQLRERNEKERIESEEIWNTALTRVNEARKTDQRNYEGALLSYANLNETIANARSADAERLRHLERTATAKSDRNARTREADLSGTCPEAAGGLSQEIRIEVGELAGLALIAAEYIRGNANVR